MVLALNAGVRVSRLLSGYDHLRRCHLPVATRKG